LCALGGEVGQVDAQGLLGDRVGGVIGKEVDAGDDRVGLEHDVAVVRRGEDRGVVGQPEGARMTGEWSKIARGQAVCPGAGIRHGRHHPPASSPARSWRASWSSTALIRPVSSRSTKALATSTYSDTTARAGTSVRRVNS